MDWVSVPPRPILFLLIFAMPCTPPLDREHPTPATRGVNTFLAGRGKMGGKEACEAGVSFALEGGGVAVCVAWPGLAG